MTVIVGGGFAGLIAAHVIPDSEVIERNPVGQMHGALLRFRSDVVAQATGIEFQKVLVRKGIWWDRHFTQPNIKVANMYSRKVTGTLAGDRSIWNIDPVERYIAPPDFYPRLVEKLEREQRLAFGIDINLLRYTERRTPFINTTPLPALVESLGIDTPEGLVFGSSGIHTLRIKLDDVSGIYQTVYFPTWKYGLYRASITDDLLILEFVRDTEDNDEWIADVTRAFWLDPAVRGVIENRLADAEQHRGIIGTQKYGKITPLPSSVRKALLLYLTAQFNIYSIGRFATWRNILLDDVVRDARLVKGMMTQDDYHAAVKRHSL